MSKLEQKTIHCFNCPGTCCTYQANSMQITPLEALDILRGLNIDTYSPIELETFKDKMRETITNYRLAVSAHTGKKNTPFLRKTYTCPFFNHTVRGCALSRSIKPYGCLGFNPKTNEDNGSSCHTDFNLLEKRENKYLLSENVANELIRQKLNIHWDKINIPQALLDLLI